jgi:hypothetical protein
MLSDCDIFNCYPCGLKWNYNGLRVLAILMTSGIRLMNEHTIFMHR